MGQVGPARPFLVEVSDSEDMNRIEPAQGGPEFVGFGGRHTPAPPMPLQDRPCGGGPQVVVSLLIGGLVGGYFRSDVCRRRF